MDKYKFVSPSQMCVKTFTLPPMHFDQEPLKFQPPTLPLEWGESKDPASKQEVKAHLTAWVSSILIILTILAVLYALFKICRYISSLPRVCFPLYPFSTILRGTAHTNTFVEAVNLVMAEAMWAHFTTVTVHPSQLRISGYPCAHDMNIIKICCFRQLQIDWQNIVLMDLDKNIIRLPLLGKISIWATNDMGSIQKNTPYQIKVFRWILDLIQLLDIKDDMYLTDHQLN